MRHESLGFPEHRISASRSRPTTCCSPLSRDFTPRLKGEETALEQQSLLAACVRGLLARHTERAPPTLGTANAHQAIKRAKTYLQERFNEPVSLEELSAVAGLSRFHLLRTFGQHVGLPPRAYQIRVRIARALAFLRAGIPPACVASMVGFADQSHFTRHFKRIQSVTPGNYALSRS